MDQAQSNNPPSHNDTVTSSRDEEEPLLGGPRDASQDQDQPLWSNLIMGTGFLAQLGALLLVAAVWVMVFVHPVIFVSAHPLLNSFALLSLTQGILVLQPTTSHKQKVQGTYAHSAFNAIATISFVAAAVVIFVNKGDHVWEIKSTHAVVGFITYALLAVQVIIGVCQFYFPSIFGGPEKAKKLYKYHRISGYVILVMVLVAVCLATQTDYNLNVLGIRLWMMVAAGLLILMGTIPRIKKQKLGL